MNALKGVWRKYRQWFGLFILDTLAIMLIIDMAMDSRHLC